MTIKTLDAFLIDKVNTLPLEILRDSRLGIDVNHYITKFFDSSNSEPLAEAIGGFPMALKQTLLDDFSLFKNYQIKPVFVFSGHTVTDFSNPKRILDLNKAATTFKQRLWNIYDTESSSQRISKFPKVCESNFHDNFSGFNYEPILPELIDLLYQNNIEYLVAPYLSWSQLVYLYQEDLIDSIYGPNELILSLSIEKFIISINNQEFQYIDRLRFLQEINISHQQLLDLSIAVGCDLQPYTLPLFSNVPSNRIFEIGIEMFLRSGYGIYNIITQAQDHVSIDRFQRGIIGSQIIPVLKTNGKVGCFNFDETKPASADNQPPPSDSHDIIGQRLPHEYYFYESMGLIQTHVLQDIITGKHVVKCPSDGGNDSYKTLVSTIVPFFKNKEFNLLTQPMARFYQVKKMSYLRYYDHKELNLENKLSIPIFFKLSKIVIKNDEKIFNLKKFFNFLKSSDLISKPISKKIDLDDSQKIQFNYDIISTTLLREFYLLGFFKLSENNNNNNNNFEIVANEWTPVLFSLCEISEDNLSNTLLLLISLRLKAFNLNNYITSIKPFSMTNETIVRLASFIQITQSSIPYKGPVNKKILSFRSSLQLIKTHTRDLFECILVSALANNEISKINKTNEQWRELVSQLPFKQTVPNTIFAQIVETLLSNNEDSNVFKFYKENIIDPNNDLEKFIKFVKEIVDKIVPILENSKLISDELILSFKKAGEFISKLKK